MDPTLIPFSVEMYQWQRRDVTIHAPDAHTAVRLALRENPGFTAEGVNDPRAGCSGADKMVLGLCESCAKPILEGDPYGVGEDGVQICGACAGDAA